MALRALALARFGRAAGALERAADRALALLDASAGTSDAHGASVGLAEYARLRHDVVALRAAARRARSVAPPRAGAGAGSRGTGRSGPNGGVAPNAGSVSGPSELADALAGPIRDRAPAEIAVSWDGLDILASLRADADGYQTLCLLPPADAEPSSLLEPMLAVAWETIEARIGRPLAEHRAEPIALRLVGADRATTLQVGVSIVIVRNQVLFTGWVGTDGRVMLRLFPPGGQWRETRSTPASTWPPKWSARGLPRASETGA